MFIREKHRKHEGIGPPYLVLVESCATPRGTRQKILLSLGRMDLSREQRLALADMVGRRLAGQQSVLEEPADLKMLADQIVARMVERSSRRVSSPGRAATLPEWRGQIRVQGVKEFGSVAVIEHFWKILGLEDLFRGAGASESEVMRIKLAVFCRLLGFDTATEGIERCEAVCFGEWFPVASKYYRREKVLVSDRILKSRNVFEDLLWQSQRDLLGEGEAGRFMDLRNLCIHILLDNRGFVIGHDVLPRGALHGGRLLDMVRMIAERQGASPAVVLDSCYTMEKDLTMLADACIPYYVIRDSHMLFLIVENLLSTIQHEGFAAEMAGGVTRSPGHGDLYLCHDLRQGRCRPGFSMCRADGRGSQAPMQKEWFLRTNGYSDGMADILRNLTMLVQMRQGFIRCGGSAFRNQSRRALSRDAFVSLLAYRISRAIDELMKSSGDVRGWDKICRTLETHSSVSIEIAEEQNGGYSHTLTLAAEPDNEVAEMYRKLGMPPPAVKGAGRIREETALLQMPLQ